jgi:PadR family transcriptional regulator
VRTSDVQSHDPQQFIPLSPSDFQLLLALSSGPLHGYGIMKAVDETSRSRVRIEIGSVYRIVARLLTAGLIAEDRAAGAVVHAGKARRTYRLTGLGLAVLRAEAQRLRDAVSLANPLLESPGEHR